MDVSIISALNSNCRGCVDPKLEEQCKQDNPWYTKSEEADKKLEEAFPCLKTEKGYDLLGEVEYAFEELGFHNGFQLAVRLMAECR